MEIGNTLREAREQYNYTLDDIQERTKIQKRYLVAIENNNFDVLPGRFYARAFIKEYAYVVGLDVVELLADFDEDNIDYEEKQVGQSSRLNRMKKRDTGGSSRIFSLLPTVIVVILVLGIVFVAWTLIQKTLTDNKEETPGESDHIIRNSGQDNGEADVNDNAAEPDEENATTADNNEEEEIPEVEPTFEVTTIGTGTSPTSDMTFTYTGDTVEISFEATDRTYIDLIGETENYIGETLTPDSELVTFDISDETEVFLNVGYTAGLVVKINDVNLEYPAEAYHQKVNLKLIKVE